MKKELRTSDALLVAMDFSHGDDTGVVIVGRKMPNGTTDIVNAFQGKDALDIYKLLITKKKG